MKSGPEIVKAGLRLFFENAAEDIEKTVENLKLGKVSQNRTQVKGVSQNISYTTVALLPVLTSLFEHIAQHQFGDDVILDDMQVSCYRIMCSIYSLGTTKNPYVERQRPALGECLARLAAAFPVAYVEPHLNEYNMFSVYNTKTPRERAILGLPNQVEEMCPDIPPLDILMKEIGDLAESGARYTEMPHVIEVTLPMLCNYLPRWWERGPENCPETEGLSCTEVTSEHLNMLLGNIMKIVVNNLGIEEASWMKRLAVFAQPIVSRAKSEMLKSHFIPTMEKLKKRSGKVVAEEDALRLEAKSESSEAEAIIKDEFSVLCRDLYALYPLLIRYVDNNRATWLTCPDPDAEDLFRMVGEVFIFWSKSHSGGSDQERTKKQRRGDRYSVQTSLIVAALKKMLPIGLNMCSPADQELINLAKLRYSLKDTDEEVREFLTNNMHLQGKVENSSIRWQMALYKELSGKAEDFEDPEKVVKRVQETEHPFKSKKAVWHKLLSKQRRRAVVACFRMTPLYNLPRHRASNMFFDGFKRSWIGTEGYSFEDRMINDLADSSQIGLLKELLDLQKDMVVMLLSLLEGNVVNGTIARQMVDMLVESSSNVEMILKFFDMFLKLKDIVASDAFMDYVTDLRGLISKKDFQKAMDSQKQYTPSEIQFLLSCSEADENEMINYEEFANRFQEPAKDIGFNIAVLLTNLSEHVPHDTRLQGFLEQAESILGYFQPFLGRIEVMGPSKRIERIYFEISETNRAQWEMPQVKESKRQFIFDVVNEGGESEKMEMFVNFCEDTIFEMQIASQISECEEEEGKEESDEEEGKGGGGGGEEGGGEGEGGGDAAEPGSAFSEFVNGFLEFLGMFTFRNLRRQFRRLKRMTLKEMVVGLWSFFWALLMGILHFAYSFCKGFFLLVWTTLFGGGLVEGAKNITVTEILASMPDLKEMVVGLWSFFWALLMGILHFAYSFCKGFFLLVWTTLFGGGLVEGAKNITVTEILASMPDPTQDEVHGDLPSEGGSKEEQEAAGTADSLDPSKGEETADDSADMHGAERKELGPPGGLGDIGETTTVEPPTPEGSPIAKRKVQPEDETQETKVIEEPPPEPEKADMENGEKAAKEGGEQTEEGGEAEEEAHKKKTKREKKPAEPEDEFQFWSEMEIQRIKFLNYLSRNFYNLRFLALFVSFALNFILLFYKVSESPSGDDDFEGSGLFEQEMEGSGFEEGGDEDEEDSVVFFFLEESTGYMQPTLFFLSILHTLISFLCIIGYNCLKVPLVIFKREKELARKLEFDGLYITEQPEDDDIKGQWDRLVLNTPITSIDIKYQLWKNGVVFTDNTFLYLVWYMVMSLLGHYNNFFFACHLLDIAMGVKTLRTILSSVTHNGKQCYLFHMYVGVRAGGGIGDEIEDPAGDEYELYRVVFDITFFFFVIVILLAIIQGLIIDAFGELRDQQEQVKEDMETKCFICGIGSDYFDTTPHGFETHTLEEHNLANYMVSVLTLSPGCRFNINFLVGYSRDIVFHLNPRILENVVVRNSFIGGSWGQEERELEFNPFQAGQYFDRFKVFVNGQHLCNFNHRFMEFQQVDTIEVQGDVQLSYVQF
ncbi:UNVERIFIED_CONTAM: hypothetical protein FKN15_069416 [Acipenser sinensis]